MKHHDTEKISASLERKEDLVHRLVLLVVSRVGRGSGGVTVNVLRGFDRTGEIVCNYEQVATRCSLSQSQEFFVAAIDLVEFAFKRACDLVLDEIKNLFVVKADAHVLNFGLGIPVDRELGNVFECDPLSVNVDFGRHEFFKQNSQDMPRSEA